MDESKVPAVSDPRWEQWSKPLFEFLRKPRNWKALNGWCREVRFGGGKLRHCLAWLEIRGRIRSFTLDDALCWVSSDYNGEVVEPDVVPMGESSIPSGAPEPSVYEEEANPELSPGEPSMQS